jgi:hypothetical protein
VWWRPRSHLAANVQEVVACLVQGVYRDPPQRPLMGFWVVVDNCAISVVFTQLDKDIAEQLRSIGELTGHIFGLLLGIAIVLDSLIASHRRAVRSHYPASREYPLPLQQQHVPQVASVLQGRPHPGLSPGSQVDVVAVQDGHDLGDLPTNILGDRLCLSEVVNETAVPTLHGHAATVTDRFFVSFTNKSHRLGGGSNRVANSISHPGDNPPVGERRSCPIHGDTALIHLMNQRGVFGLQRARAEYSCASA